MKVGTSFRLRLGIIALAVLATLPCFAADSAVLRNGFSIRHERRESHGTITRLYLNRDGSSYVDVPTLDIDHYEAALEENAASGSGRAASSLGPQGSRASAPAGGFGVQAAKRVFSEADLNSFVNTSSGRYRLDPDLVNSVIKAESGFNVRAVSRKGAQGLMQLMPDTASKLGVPNAFDPQANVEGGTRYLRELLERYNFDLIKALAAYNAGPQRVEQFGGVPPYIETRAYVARVVKDFNKKKVAQKVAGRNSAKRASVDKNSGSGVASAKQAQAKVNLAQTKE